MGIKERRTKILVALFFLSDINFSTVEITPFVERVFDISLNQKTKSTLKQLLKQGYIQQEGTTESPQEKKYIFSLTASGLESLSMDFPFCRFLNRTWDSKWRILSYEIPESKRELRDKLRREVAGWGLGPWHRSFWLTPHPIIDNLRELVFQKEEEKYIQAFEADHVFGDRAILIEKVWQKSSLENTYRELFKQWHLILSGQETKEDKFKKVIRDYITVLRNDPGLPKELIGDNWIGFEANSIFKEIRSILLSA